MATGDRKFNLIALGAMLALAYCLTGCASSQSKLEAFQKAGEEKGFIYVQVNYVEPGINTKSACESNFGGEKLKQRRELICHRLDGINVAYASQIKDLHTLVVKEVVPSSIEINPGSIIKLDLSKESPFRFVEVAALKPTESCKWVGSDNDQLDSSLRKASQVAGGFLGGLISIPAGLVYFYGVDHKGGVECDGWSYKKAYEAYLSRN